MAFKNKRIYSLSDVEERLELLERQLEHGNITTQQLATSAASYLSLLEELQSTQSTTDIRAAQAKLQRLLLGQQDTLIGLARDLNDRMQPAIEDKDLEATKELIQQAGALQVALRGIDSQLDSDGRTALDRLSLTFSLRKKEYDRWVEIRRVQDKIEELLQHADDPDNPGQIALQFANDALNTANAAFDEYASESSMLRVLLGRLQNKSETARDELRRLHQMPTTRTTIGGLVELIRDWHHLAKSQPDKIVTYWADSSEAADQKEQPVSSALIIARQRYQSDVRKKILEYVADATKALDENAPNKARAALEQWNRIPGFFEKDVLSTAFQTSLRNLVNPKKQEVDAVYDRWTQARNWIRQANEVVDKEPLRAIELYQKALGEQGYPNHPDLPELSRNIEESTAQHLIELIEEVENATNYEQWLDVERHLRYADILLPYGSLPHNLKDKLNVLSDVYQSGIAPWRQNDWSTSEERQYLQQLSVRYPDYWSSWGYLRKRATELDARQSADGIIADINRICDPQAQLEELNQLYKDAQDIYQSPPPTFTKSDLRPLEKAIQRVTAWIGFVEARDQFNLNSVDPNDVYLDLELVQVPDLGIIKRALESASKEAEVARAVQNAKFKKRLQLLKKNDRRASNLLKQAKNLFEVTSTIELNQLRELNKELRMIVRRPSSLRNELLDVYRDVRQRLITIIELELMSIVLKDEKYYQNLPIHKTKMLLEELRRV